MQMLEAPAMLNQIVCKPIKQLGVRWTPSVKPKVVGRLHDAYAKMVLPDAVDDHSREQRIASFGNPFRQF